MADLCQQDCVTLIHEQSESGGVTVNVTTGEALTGKYLYL